MREEEGEKRKGRRRERRKGRRRERRKWRRREKVVEEGGGGWRRYTEVGLVGEKEQEKVDESVKHPKHVSAED